MMRTRIRPPAVAGMFYPGGAAELRSTVQALLAGAAPRPGAAGPGGPGAGGSAVPRGSAAAGGRFAKAIIAPHAGYAYSGPIAGSAFRALAPAASTRSGAAAGAVRRVVVIGPAHRVAIRGLALPEAEGFATPLGEVAVDAAACAALARLPQVAVRQDAHRDEHALEVELPFLQVLLGDFQLVPLVVGQASGDEVAEALQAVWGGDETRVVVSSDLSHYLPAAGAERVDRATAAQVMALGGPLATDQACGAIPINGLLVMARRRLLQPRQLDLRHSGDTSGDRSRVVGYGAWAFDQHVE